MFILITVFITVAISSLARFYAEHIESGFRTAFTTRLLRTALLRTIATTVVAIGALTTRLLTFRTNEDAALTVLTTLTIVIAETTLLALGTVLTALTIVIAETTLLTLGTVLTTLTIIVVTETALTALAIVIAETTLLALGTVLTTLTVVVVAILLGLIVSVTCVLHRLFRLLLLLNRCSLLRLFLFHRRLLFFSKCLINNVHFFSVYAAKVSFIVDIIFLQNINDFIAAFADFFSNFVYSFTHSSTS